MRNIIFILLTGLLFSCVSQGKFTEQETKLITSGDAKTPFRVLKTSDRSDSLTLRKKSIDLSISKNKKEIQLLVERLRTTLETEQGVGIAAPQVGLQRNLFLLMRIDKPGKPVEVVINPKIVAYSEDTVCFERDGCLSVPKISGNSRRYKWIDVEYYNVENELMQERLTGYSRGNNFVAIIFQHEFDHLQGVLFTDKLCK